MARRGTTAESVRETIVIDASPAGLPVDRDEAALYDLPPRLPRRLQLVSLRWA